METQKNIKPGYKTTEFWMASIAGIVGMVIASGAFADGGVVLQVAGFVGSALAAMGYGISRGFAKSK